ncbi:unnamed protein product [Clonostachys byssicola]|uniref:Uncharacterized protein n=1 Tax=Clonostachys byssicola TaxID=160290 RepID=A0A9N9XVU3_9HYPO|nr:unnamed protein product [Clonostachys byssicola]
MTDQDGALTPTIGGSGTSSILRFITEQGKEAFFITLGIYNYKPWVDVITGLANNVTCISTLPEYYNSVHTKRCYSYKAQYTSQSILNIDHRTISVQYRVHEGHNLELDIVIG